MTNKKRFCIFTPVLLAAAAAALSGCSLLENIGVIAGADPKNNTGVVLDDGIELNYNGYGFRALQNNEERRLYARIDRALNSENSTEFKTEALGDAEKIRDVLDMYKDDFPGVFWVDETEPFTYIEHKNEGTVTVLFNRKYDGGELADAKQRLEERIQEFVDGAPQNGSEYERELYVHDWLVDNCEYDTEAVEIHKSDSVRANEQNVYGAIVEGKAVCEGYARAFQLLCGRLGVHCGVIQGRAEGFADGENTNHIWNCVRLEGNWYPVDVTWDDLDSDDVVGSEQYIYFNLTTEVMCEDHKIAPGFSEYSSDSDWWYNAFVPECTSTEYNYYELNALTIESLDAPEIVSCIADAAQRNDSYCIFVLGGNDDYKDVYDMIVEEYAYRWITSANEANGYSPEIGRECKLSGIKERRLITLVLDYE